MNSALQSVYIGIWYALVFGPLSPLAFLYVLGEWSKGRGKDVWWRQYGDGKERYATFRFHLLGSSALVVGLVEALLIARAVL